MFLHFFVAATSEYYTINFHLRHIGKQLSPNLNKTTTD